jgi:hypothetical protein
MSGDGGASGVTANGRQAAPSNIACPSTCASASLSAVKASLWPVLTALVLTARLEAQTAPDGAELTRLLREFLDGASRNDAAVHDRFWAEDLVYTRSAGTRVGKKEILDGLRAAPAPQPGAPTTLYFAEDIRIQQYGDTAIVAFQLVGTTQRDGKAEVARFLNTGTFLRRSGRWQAVTWQATRVPRGDEQAKPEVLAAHDGLNQALLTADVKALEPLLADGFVWTQGSGEQHTRDGLLQQIRSGRLKYSKLETTKVTIAVHGDTAVARGVTSRQRLSVPGAQGTGDREPFTAFYTLTFVNQGSGWKAVALHSSRAP